MMTINRSSHARSSSYTLDDPVFEQIRPTFAAKASQLFFQEFLLEERGNDDVEIGMAPKFSSKIKISRIKFPSDFQWFIF